MRLIIAILLATLPIGAAQASHFSINQEQYFMSIISGESGSMEIEISNNGATDSSFSIELEGIVKRFAVAELDEISIQAGGNGTFKVNVGASLDSEPGVYTGFVSISGAGHKLRVPLTIEVAQSEQAKGIKIHVIQKNAEGKLRYSISFFNLEGFSGKGYESVKGPENIVFRPFDVLSQGGEQTREVELGNISSGSYALEVRIEGGNESYFAADSFDVDIKQQDFNYMPLLIYAIAAGGIGGGGYFGLLRYRRYKAAKAKFMFPINFSNLPQSGGWIGKVAETGHKAFFDLNELTTHLITAGSTGSGKTVSTMVVVEEALKNKVAVIVFDPTAQWTGFVRRCTEKEMLDCYPKFGMKDDDARPFNGMIYDVENPKDRINFKELVKPGEITVFTLNKLRAGQYDDAVRNIIDTMFRENWEESSELKLLVVFDEVHRLLERYGGKGGYVALEKAAREFRKWGIGIIMVSQVLADFKEALKGNVMTEIMFHTKSMEDIERAANNFGTEYSDKVTKQSVGIGMIQNPKYNKGRPWFVEFRPVYHNPQRISREEMEKYKKYAAKLLDLKQKVSKLGRKKDVSDIELELSLAGEKLKTGMFQMVDFYIESVEGQIKKSK